MRRRSNPFSKGDPRRGHEATSDLWLKVVAFALAFLLWTVTKSDSRKVIRNVPVRVNLTDPEWVMMGAPEPPVVDVRVSGPVRELIRLTSGRAVVEVRVDQVTDSLGRFPLRPSAVQLFDGADSTRVIEVVGDSVRVVFASIVERVLPVAPRASGGPPAGYELAGRLRAIPASVRVRGASARVFAAGLDSIMLPPIDLGSFTGTDTVTVALDLNGLDVMSVYPTSVDVIVPMRLEQPDTVAQGDVALGTRGGTR